jgi:hypothetical protein
MPQFSQAEFDDDLLAILQNVDPETRRIVLELQDQNKQMMHTYFNMLNVRAYINVISVLNIMLFAITVFFWIKS